MVALHTDHVVLRNATFRVGKKGRERAIREKRRNVHAKVHGTFAREQVDPHGFRPISYNPFRHDFFYDQTTGEPVHEAEIVVFRDGKCWIPAA